MTSQDRRDRFGNPHSPGVPYARGDLITSTADDLQKLRAAWQLMRQRVAEGGLDSVHQLSGLERGLHLESEDMALLDDELAAALCLEELTALGLEHMGGQAPDHDIMMLNRVTAGLLVAAEILIEPGERVIGVSARYSHPAVVRAVAHAGGQFTDTAGLGAFRAALASGAPVSTVVLTRLAVSYEILPEAEIREIVRLAKAAGARILVDDAGGARVGPAVFDQPKTMALGVDVGVTGLDKYGTVGPRLGLLVGHNDLVRKIRARAFEIGLEARPMLYPAVVRSLKGYRPERVRELVDCTKLVAAELKDRLGANRLFETPVTIQIPAEDLLEIALERAGLVQAPVVPYEATAALAMLLLRDHGILTVHFAGLPPGTAALMIKFVPPETLARFGGAAQLADAVDRSIDQLAETLKRPEAMAELILGAKAQMPEVTGQVPEN
ncbi:MAG: hypothetical protein AAF495_01465 [Pseudomonadota bacterium]